MAKEKGAVTVERAVKLLTMEYEQDSDDGQLRYTDAFFSTLDSWQKAFELRSQGFNFRSISKVLNVTEKTAHAYYQRYVLLQSKLLYNEVSGRAQNEIAAHLARLDRHRENLQLKLATMESDSTSDMQNILITTKLIIEIEKQVATTKRSLGIWRPITDIDLAVMKEQEKAQDIIQEEDLELLSDKELEQYEALQLKTIKNKLKKLLT